MDFTSSTLKNTSYADTRILIYKTIRQLVFIVFIGIIIKYTLCDTVLIQTDQMKPTIQNGDRVVLSRKQFSAPLNMLFKLKHHDPVVFTLPYSDKIGCLRIAAKPGDVVTIQKGIFSTSDNNVVLTFSEDTENEILPAEFSPRDNITQFHIPVKGDTIAFAKLTNRDFIFLFSMLKQEQPRINYALKPMLHIDDTLSNDCIISNFSLYKGVFSDIPDSLNENWFFWDRLEAYLISSFESSKINLFFSIIDLDDQSYLYEYIVKKDFFFLIADDWFKGYDSRYFGPVCLSRMKGKVIGILWSFTPGESIIGTLKSRRIAKIIK